MASSYDYPSFLPLSFSSLQEDLFILLRSGFRREEETSALLALLTVRLFAHSLF
jgi:hypothetical protein